jgi:hypothetical protein
MRSSETVIVREWDPEIFHRRVVDLEGKGYTAQLESYQVVPEMNPETGEVIHLRTVEMKKKTSDKTEVKIRSH